MEQVKLINGIEIKNDDKLSPQKFAGYFTRDSKVVVTYLDNDLPFFVPNKSVNELLSNYMNSDLLKSIRKKIEKLDDYIIQIGRNLIDDYNHQYSYLTHDPNVYLETSKMSLIRLEQLFILNDWPTIYIYDFFKPRLNCKFHELISRMLKSITKLRVDKIKQLKAYLDEYFQFVFDRPKNIYRINELMLPIAIDCIQTISAEQLAAYLVRSSDNVRLECIDNCDVDIVNNIVANASFISWIKAIFGSDSDELKKIYEYQRKIENPSESIKNLEMKLSLNPEQTQDLIKMEQLIIRHKLSSDIINEYTRKDGNVINENLYGWIVKITNLNKKQIKNLKDYLDSYLEYIKKTEN